MEIPTLTGITDLDELLSSMRPRLNATEFVFCSVSGALSDYIALNPIASFLEPEGLTLVLEKAVAQRSSLTFSGVYKQITLTVHSSLEAVGLTAAVANKLTEKGISANVIAAYYHDHIFVQASNADAAISALEEFSV